MLYCTQADLTIACAANLSFSGVADENSGGVTVPTDLLPSCHESNPWLSMSEKPESRGGVRELSKLSANDWNISTLCLPELTKDMSVSGAESSYGLPFGAFL